MFFIVQETILLCHNILQKRFFIAFPVMKGMYIRKTKTNNSSTGETDFMFSQNSFYSPPKPVYWKSNVRYKSNAQLNATSVDW
jgi:hypothetical protein